MKKIVRLTESDLVKLVKRVISEQATTKGPALEPEAVDKIIKAINSAGNYIDINTGKFLRPLELKFVRGTMKNTGEKLTKFGYSDTTEEPQIINFNIGDQLNSSEQATRKYDTVVVKEKGNLLKMNFGLTGDRSGGANIGLIRI